MYTKGTEIIMEQTGVYKLSIGQLKQPVLFLK